MFVIGQKCEFDYQETCLLKVRFNNIYFLLKKVLFCKHWILILFTYELEIKKDKVIKLAQVTMYSKARLLEPLGLRKNGLYSGVVLLHVLS